MHQNKPTILHRCPNSPTSRLPKLQQSDPFKIPALSRDHEKESAILGTNVRVMRFRRRYLPGMAYKDTLETGFRK